MLLHGEVVLGGDQSLEQAIKGLGAHYRTPNNLIQAQGTDAVWDGTQHLTGLRELQTAEVQHHGRRGELAESAPQTDIRHTCT